MKLSLAILALSSCLYHPSLNAAADVTDFVVSPDATTFKPTTPLRKGDRLQVQSPRLPANEVLLLVQCKNGCAETKIVRAWSGRKSAAPQGPDLLEWVTILEDGDYYFAPNEIPPNIPSANFHGCIRSLPLHKLCSDARPQKITESKTEGGWFRAHLSTRGSWVWVRYTRH